MSYGDVFRIVYKKKEVLNRMNITFLLLKSPVFLFFLIEPEHAMRGNVSGYVHLMQEGD